MTKDRKEAIKNSQYKQVFVKEISGERYYTQCNMGEDDYMNLSPIWKSLRRKKLQLNPTCEKCGVAYNLQVHHIRYPDIWGEEEIDDLMTVCDRCHNEIHGKNHTNDNKLENVPF